MMLSTENLLAFHCRQLELWPLAAANFKALDGVEIKKMTVSGLKMKVQHNPARILSTAAKVDKASLAARPCFLCTKNRPTEQIAFPVLDERYSVLVNPFPIFKVHFTIPATDHVEQLISADGARRFADMFLLAKSLCGLAIFYNGPHCGASAPDHFHFQAVEAKVVPMFEWIESQCRLPFKVFTALWTDEHDAVAWFRHVCSQLASYEENNGEPEPRMNVWCVVREDGSVRVVVIPRRAHRPDFYGSGDNQLLLSPASVDLAGVVVVPSPADFHQKLTSNHLEQMLSQVCY